ncbi:FusB/FusC family EF-G-binding protein [Sporosarcina psychrophila]|uniref:Elongation factor G-binding protein n=1 Tax=Sporosarcina psychrophila TaxID=1476 RepID=A0ABV2KBS7_SPOPS
MLNLFIENHQFNNINHQAHLIVNACKNSFNNDVILAAKFSGLEKIKDQFKELSKSESKVLEQIIQIDSSDSCENFLNEVEKYRKDIKKISEKELKKSFPKRKKISIPNYLINSTNKISFFSWDDLGYKKRFLLYQLNGEYIGIEGTYSSISHNSFCSFCRMKNKVHLVAFLSKAKSSNPDYYKTISQYICLDIEKCNAQIKDLSHLEDLFYELLKNDL